MKAITRVAVCAVLSTLLLHCSPSTPTPTSIPRPSHTPTARPTPTPEPSPTTTVTRCITYVTAPGDTLWDIAARFGTTYQAIMHTNGLTDSLIHSGTALCIPTSDKSLAGAPLTVSSQDNPTPEPPPPSPIGDVTAAPLQCPQGCTYHPPGCDIKGNISIDAGEKIYHLPGAEYYDETIIRPDYGERWFCTEQEAITNGWRRSKV